MDNHENAVRTRLAAGELALGAKVDLASPDIVEIVGAAGYDFVWIDCEHGAFDLETVVHMLRAADAAGVTPVVRVPSDAPSGIARALDAGAMGVIVPNVERAAQAEAVVRAARYQTAATPYGRRGACPRIRAARHQVGDWNTFADWSNSTTMVWVLVETAEGAARIEEIVAVPGIDAVMLGPFDLSVSLGYPGQTTHPMVIAQLERITAACRRRGVEVVAVLLGGDDDALAADRRRWVDRGCRILNVVSDRRLLAGGLRGIEKAMRAPVAPPVPRSA